MKKLSSALLSLILLGSCASRPKPVADPNASLYERLGKRPAIESVVTEMTHNINKDERINGFFIGSEPGRLIRLLTDQICMATGGPCKYTGDDMIAVHTGMNITEPQFNALVEDLIKSLNKHNVPKKEQQELLKILGSMKNHIINR